MNFMIHVALVFHDLFTTLQRAIVIPVTLVQFSMNYDEHDKRCDRNEHKKSDADFTSARPATFSQQLCET